MKVADETVSTFNARASMLGYLCQVRVALLRAIRQSRAGNFSVSLEMLDDVSFESHGDPVAVLQTSIRFFPRPGWGISALTSGRRCVFGWWAGAAARCRLPR